MSSNPYAPPKSEVADVDLLHPSSGTHVYLSVSVAKLLLLSFGTLGLYQYYWFYKNWQLHKLRTGESVSPFWRTFFGIIFCYPLFRRIGEYASTSGTSGLNAGAFAAGWIIPSLLWKLPDPYWLVIFLAVFALVPVQRTVNEINAKTAPECAVNAKIKGWNWLAVFPGLLLLALSILGAFLPNA